MLSGVRPIISLAALPTARIRLSSTETATTDGSLMMMPFLGTNITVFVVPKSMPIFRVITPHGSAIHAEIQRRAGCRMHYFVVLCANAYQDSSHPVLGGGSQLLRGRVHHDPLRPGIRLRFRCSALRAHGRDCRIGEYRCESVRG